MINAPSKYFHLQKSTIETLEKVWNMFKVNSKDTRTTTLTCKYFLGRIKYVL